ncbi:MAG: lantibiotic dehydratase C-terminal domain-containing protein [Jatrophihabitantaceae bacterium]
MSAETVPVNAALPELDCLVVSYHDDDKAALLADCLLPIAGRLQQRTGGELAFLERHWLRGPHLRLTLPAAGPGLDRAGLLAEINDYLQAKPSTKPVDDEQYGQLSQALGRAELVRPPYVPIRPDNTVSIEPYPVSATAELIGAIGFELKQGFLSSAVTPLRFAMDLIGSGAHRLIPAFSVLVAHAARWPVGGLATGQLSYRSHLEDYLAQHDPDGRIRDVLADRFRRVEPVLRPLLQAQVADTRTGRYHGSDGYLAAWSTAFDRAWPPVLAAAGAGQLGEDLGPGYLDTARGFDPTTERQWRFGADRPSSEFHHELAKLNYLPERMHVVEFAAYRFMTNQVTRWLPLLGISPLERYLASYAVSELVESEFGVSWRDQLATIQRDPNAQLSKGNQT